jgi:hypothetical protein
VGDLVDGELFLLLELALCGEGVLLEEEPDLVPAVQEVLVRLRL